MAADGDWLRCVDYKDFCSPLSFIGLRVSLARRIMIDNPVALRSSFLELRSCRRCRCHTWWDSACC